MEKDKSKQIDRAKKNERVKRIRQSQTFETRLRIKKLVMISIAIFLSFIFLAFEVAKIKVENGKEYELQAIAQLLKNSQSEEIIAPNRGAIVDRNNINIAISVTVYDLFIDVRLLINREDEVIDRTIEIINTVFPEITTEYLREITTIDRVETNLSGKETKIPLEKYDTKHLVLLKDVNRIKATEIEEAIDDKNIKLTIRDIYLESKSKRSYLFDSLAANVIGFTRGDSSHGLEKKYNSYLEGTPGRIFKTYSSDDTIKTEQIKAEDGNKLITTIDLEIQKYCEEASKTYGEKYEAEKASSIVMNPKTGELLAMAIYPSFDLNNPASVEGLTSSALKSNWAALENVELVNNLESLWKNWDITEIFEPGSIFKPITVAMALEEGVISKDEQFLCLGNKIVSGIAIPCHKLDGHGYISLEEALAYSCNVAMMDIAEKIGRDNFYKYYTEFGFGDTTGIDLPAEGAGLIFELAGLNSVELATSSFGQRFEATALQSLSAFSATINGGNLMRPYVVSQVTDSKGGTVLENKPEIVRKLISQDTSDYIRKALEKTVSVGFTGHKAIIPGYAIGGKTGTGEQGLKGSEDYHYTLTFIGYLPVDNVEYIAMTIIHRPKEYVEGSTSAAPMLKEILEKLIKYKKIPKSYSDAENTDVTATSNKVTVDDYMGKTLQEATNHLNSVGLNYKLIGGAGNIVSKQWPSAGTIVDINSNVLLTIKLGEEQFEMVTIPNLIGLDELQATELLESIGLEHFAFYVDELSKDNTEENNKQATDSTIIDQSSEDNLADENLILYVIEQMPEADISVMKGTQVKLQLSSNTNSTLSP